MVKFLLKTFIDNIIVCILFLSIFSLFESSYPWGALGSVMLGIAIYGGFALILTIPNGLMKICCSDIAVSENVLLFSLFILLEPIYEDIGNVFSGYFYFRSCIIAYVGFFFCIQYIVYLLLRSYIKRHCNYILYLRMADAFLSSCRTITYISIAVIVLFVLLALKDCSNGFLMEQRTVTCTDAEEFQYWDDLDENSKTEIIKSIDVDKNIMKLYLHKIKLSDNDMSATILDTLSSSTDGYKRMLHFYILNEIVNTADGAVAEMVSGYCVKYVNENTDYALEYFSKHQDVAINYVYIIAGELYLSDTSFTQYEQLLFDSAKSKCAKEYLPTFLKEIKRILAKINL